jgi:hypothetical protein
LKFILTILFIGLFAKINAQKSAMPSLQNTVLAFHKAMVNANIDSVKNLIDPALTYGHSNGWIENSLEFINNQKTSFIQYHSIKEDSINIAINKNVATVRFNAIINASLKGVAKEYHLKVLEVWTLVKNKWLLLARQSVTHQKNTSE